MKLSFHTAALGAVFCAALCVMLGSCATAGGTVTESFTVDSRGTPVTLGEIELQMESFLGLGNLKKIAVPVTYYPKDDAVCLQYRYNLINFYQFWSRKGRMYFQSALDSYNNDYNERNLSRNERKSGEKYGETVGYLVWQQGNFLVRAEGNMKIHFGYTFKNRAPFFTVLQLQAEYTDEMTRDNDRTSDVVLMYFTRAQAAALAALLDQEILDQYKLNVSSDKDKNDDYYMERDDY